jgi:hypothetical protein
MSDNKTLRAENERLRELLIENDIDPDPEPPAPPYFTVPTLAEWRISQMFARSAEYWLKSIEGTNALREFLEGSEWSEGQLLRVRMPTDFQVNRIR